MSTGDSAAFDALTAKVEELGQVCARLSRENAELRARVSGLPAGIARGDACPDAPGTDAGPEPAVLERRVSRRMLGKALGAAAAGAVGAAALVDLGSQPAAAVNGSNITAGNVTTTEAGTTLQYDGASALGGVVFLGNDTGFSNSAAAFPAALGGWAGSHVPHGIYGFTENDNGNAIVGSYAGTTNGGAAVFGQSFSSAGGAIAVRGLITSTSPGGFSAAVRGQNNGTGGSGIGVWGSQNGSGWGVLATSASGIGVNASGGSGVGVNASGGTGVAASGSSVGVSASGNTVGVSAFGPTAVRGKSSNGRGGVFSGTAAQVQLVPGSKSTHPKSGKRGDLYADSTGRLWFCKKGGTTATWHQIA